MKPIEITEQAYTRLLIILREDYPLSVTTISWKMKKVLGLTFRTHSTYDSHGYHRNTVFLDFFDDEKKTFFLMKYSEVLKCDN